VLSEWWFAAWASTIWPLSKVFLMAISGKRVLYKYVNDGTSKGSFASARGGAYQCGRGLSLEGEIVRYPSVNLSPTLSRNEKVEQHIRKKTQCLKVLGWRWCHSLVGCTLVSFLVVSPVFLPSIFPSSKVLGWRWCHSLVCLAHGLRLGRVQFDPVSKVFLTDVNNGTSNMSFASTRGGVYQCGRGTLTWGEDC